jgi:hypothetical protein
MGGKPRVASSGHLSLEELEGLAIVHKRGPCIVRAGFHLCFYIERPLQECKEPVLELYSRFLEMCGKESLVWVADQSMEQHRRVSARSFELPRAQLASGRDLVCFEIKSGRPKYHADAGECCFSFTSRLRSNRLFAKRANVVELVLPLRFAFEDHDTILSLARGFCRKVPTLSGHAGVALNVSRYYEARGAFRDALQVAMRYPDLDIREPEWAQCIKKYGGVKSIAWLNILNTRLAKGLKGYDPQLSETAGKNLLIRVAEQPMVSRAKQGAPAFRQAYQWLHPLVTGPPFPLRNISTDFDERMAMTRAWVHRFK